MTQYAVPAGMTITGRYAPEYAQILTAEALAFLARLHRGFNARRVELLARRAERQKQIDSGKLPDFLPETRPIREADWTVAPVPSDLQDRRVENTGPTAPQKVLHALNPAAHVYIAGFRDSNNPTRDNHIHGQIKKNGKGRVGEEGRYRGSPHQ